MKYEILNMYVFHKDEDIWSFGPLVHYGFNTYWLNVMLVNQLNINMT